MNRFKTLAAIFMIGLLAGCASRQQIETFTPIAQIVVMKVIENDKEHAHERAVKIREITSEAQTLLDSADFTVPLLESALTARLAALDLAPSDRVLGLQLIKLIVNELHARVGEGVVTPDQKYSVSLVFAAIEEAASFY